MPPYRVEIHIFFKLFGILSLNSYSVLRNRRHHRIRGKCMAVLKIVSFIALLTAVLSASGPDVSITGIVTDGKDPLKGARVGLVSNTKIADTTDTNGIFNLSTATAVRSSGNLLLRNDIQMRIRGTALLFTLRSYAEKGTFSVFSASGQRVIHIQMSNLASQPHYITLPQISPGIYLISISTGIVSTIRTLISNGVVAYINEAIAFSSDIDNRIKAKQASKAKDQLKIEKQGFVTQTVEIDSYQIVNLKITLQKESAGPCNGGKWVTTDVSKIGPFETVSETVDGAILYRPKDMLTGCLYPVITWGHGAGGSPSNYTTVLKMMASHGFVVIASSAGNVQDGGSSANQFKNKMVEAAQWVVKQNSTSSSVLYQKIDTAKIGSAGHSQGGYGASEAGQNPLIKTSVSICGAVGSPNQKGPAFIICGGQDNNSGAKCSDHPTASFTGTSGVPVFLGKCLNADHGNWGFEAMLSDKTKPHDIVQATIAWFRYHLMGDEAYRSWFYGADCFLCKHANWSVQRKQMD
jgi:dienelactone hydrolase